MYKTIRTYDTTRSSGSVTNKNVELSNIAEAATSYVIARRMTREMR